MKLHLSITLVRLICLGLALILGTAAWISHDQALIQPLELRILDRLHRLQPHPPEPPVMLISIQDSGKRGWPWSSLDYAVFLNAIAPFQPEVVGLSVPLQEGDPVYRIYDTQLGRQIEKLNRVTLACSGTEGNPLSPGGIPTLYLKGTAPPSIMPFDGANLPAPEIRRLASVGLNILPVDTDYLVRKVPLVVLHRERIAATFLLQSYGLYLKTDWDLSECTPSWIILRNSTGRMLARIPIDSEGCLILHFYASTLYKPAVEFYQAVVASEQVRNGLNPSMDMRQLHGKVILLGTEAPGTYGPVHTLAGETSPVRIQLQALENLFQGDFTRPLSPSLCLLLLLAVSLIACLSATVKPLHVSLSFLSLLYTITLCGSILLYEQQWIFIPLGIIFISTATGWMLGRLLLYTLHDFNPQQELNFKL